jgi:hypothetical protein
LAAAPVVEEASCRGVGVKGGEIVEPGEPMMVTVLVTVAVTPSWPGVEDGSWAYSDAVTSLAPANVIKMARLTTSSYRPHEILALIDLQDCKRRRDFLVLPLPILSCPRRFNPKFSW